MKTTDRVFVMSSVIEINKYKSSKASSDWRRKCLQVLVDYDHKLHEPYVQAYLRSTVDYLHHINRLGLGSLPFNFSIDGPDDDKLHVEFYDGHNALYFPGETPMVGAVRPTYAHLKIAKMSTAEKERAVGMYAYSTEEADDEILRYLQQWQDLELRDGMSSLTSLPLLLTVYVLGDLGHGFKITHVHSGTRNGPHPFLRIHATHYKGVSLEFQYNHETVVREFEKFRNRERQVVCEQQLYVER